MTGSSPIPAKSIILPGLILTAFLVCCAGTFGQQNSDKELADGPFQQKRDAMQGLIRLRLKGNSLALRREWKPTRNENGVRNRLDAADEIMKQPILDAEFAKQIEDRLAQQLTGKSPLSASLGDAFFAVAQGPGGGSRSRSTSGSHSEFQFSAQTLSGKAEVADDRILFSFSELEEPAREFRVEDHQNGQFVFRYSGDGFLVELKQKDDGSVRIARILDDQAEVFSAADYVALRKQEPELVDKWLMPLFEHLGFSLPLSPDSPVVQQAALLRLVAATELSTQTFQNLVSDLEADEFNIRNTASETLMAQREIYADAIRRELETESLSPEASMRLANILKEPVAENQVEEILVEQGLLIAPEFLIGLFKIANGTQEQAIHRRLEKVTGERHPDAPSWNRWLEEQRE